MTSSTSRSTLKFAALTLSLIASALSASAAYASSPRLLAREVAGAYGMQDGSTLHIDVFRQRVLVESSGPVAPEYWTAPTADLLVSPDGLRTIKLLRDFDGRVDRIEMRITNAR